MTFLEAPENVFVSGWVAQIINADACKYDSRDS